MPNRPAPSPLGVRAAEIECDLTDEDLKKVNAYWSTAEANPNETCLAGIKIFL